MTVTTGPDINVTIGTVVNRITFLNEDEKLRFNGSTGDSYFVFNSTTNKIELFVNGVKKAAW